MYLDKPLNDYLNNLASASSTPGGGSTAALSGAMGAALTCMVARLTQGKADYTDVQVEIASIIEHVEQIRHRFQDLLQADVEAYGRLSSCFKMPRGTTEEKAARTQAIQEQLVAAALVPLEMAERAAELASYSLRVAEIGNKNVLSDIATASALATSAGAGASWMVKANTQMLKDRQRANDIETRLQTALETIARVSQRIITVVGERA